MGNFAAKSQQLYHASEADAFDRVGRAGVAAAAEAGNAADAAGAGSNLVGALSSGYGGHGGGYGYIQEEECPEGIDEDLALLITAAAIAAGAYIVFRQVTLQQGGRKRRSPLDHFGDMFFSGKF